MPRPRRLLLTAAACLTAWAALPAAAEKADRQQPMTIEAERSSTVDLAKRVVVFSGKVVLTQGTLRMEADRVEVTDLGQGQRSAVATGLPGAPAQFREKRDGLDEFVEGRAQRIDYDSRDDLIRLNGQAVVRRLRGTQLADLIEGETIVWNGAREQFSVLPGAVGAGAGGAAAGAPAGGATVGSGRVRAVLSPTPTPTPTPAASAPAAPASPAPSRTGPPSAVRP
jgi:lipopolysaccharide export system protein LptA